MAPCCIYYPQCNCSITNKSFMRKLTPPRQQGPMPRYFARLDAAEALCLWFEATYLPGSGGDELLAAWRKAKAASEAPQGEGGEGC